MPLEKAAVLFANLLQPRHVTVYGMAAAPDLNRMSMANQDNLEMHNGLPKL